jgi:hypothetical protein
MSEPGMIGQYRIGERITVGGAGEIYADLRPELASDPEWVGSFFAEALSTSISYPTILIVAATTVIIAAAAACNGAAKFLYGTFVQRLVPIPAYNIP